MNKHSSYLKINSGKIYYELINPAFITDENPLIVFLHEGLGSCKQWKDFPGKLSNELNYPCLLYDRFGYGKSDILNKPSENEPLHDEAFLYLPEILKELKIKGRIILFGHSDGGSIALLYASRFPKMVIGLITEADHVIIEDISAEGIIKTVEDFKNGNLREFLVKYHEEKTDSMFYGWSDKWLSERGKNWTMEKFLPGIQCPVLAIQGQNDQYGSVEQLISKLMNIKASMEIFHIENCGHIPHFQAKEKVFKKVVSFIQGL